MIKLLNNIADDSDQLPSSLELQGVICDYNRAPAASGGYGLVYKGTYNNAPVAIKVIIAESPTELPDVRKVRSNTGRSGTTCGTDRLATQRYRMEVLLWRQLTHPNIIHLLGIDPSKELSIVTPWKQRGTINTHLENLRKMGETPDFCRLVGDLVYQYHQWSN